jgi:hypothetical protein
MVVRKGRVGETTVEYDDRDSLFPFFSITSVVGMLDSLVNT